MSGDTSAIQMSHRVNRLRGTLMRVVLLWCSLCITTQGYADAIDYQRDIKPLFKARCYACHGALKQAGGLRLDTGHSIGRGGDSGQAIDTNKPHASLLLLRVSSSDLSERMPPEGEALTSAQIELLQKWIDAGAVSPTEEQAEADPREHWAFRAPRRTALPDELPSISSANPIDLFLESELKRHGLVAQSAADKHVQLRRIYLDLIGLPPTVEQLRSFLDDHSSDAYEKVVERLLHDPRYGERWGRHWMDIWRYSDWYGRRDANDVRNSASQIFHWRDWIVQSLNAGKGYDRMLQEMLAADELFPEDYNAGVATGYLIRNYYSLNPNDWMRSAVEHTGKAFLGLTFNCAHCHDHKYDPIEQDDYFRMRAFFEPIFIRQDRLPGEADPGMFQDYTYAGIRSVQRLGAVRIYDRQPDAPTWFYTGGDERNRVQERGSIAPAVPKILQPEALKIEPIDLPPLAWYPGLRPEIQATMRADAEQAIALAEQQLQPASSTQPLESEEVQAATEAYEQALAQATNSGYPAALTGQYSLLLDATQGRAIVQNSLNDLNALENGVTISFQLLIVKDAHVNFQLVKENKQGLTADYVGWEGGSIQAYLSGHTASVEVGKYDMATGQNRFEVSLQLQPASDEGILSIRSLADDAILVDQVSTKLNGWSPIGNDVQTICFDARPGSIAMIDDLQVFRPIGEPSQRTTALQCDFEPPKYADGVSPTGIDGWMGSTFSSSSGIAIVSSTAGNQAVHDAAVNLRQAQRKAEGPHLRYQSRAAALSAARAELVSLEARIAAERARYLEDVSPDRRAELMQLASRAERQAFLQQAESDVLKYDVALLDAQSKPVDDKQRAGEIDAATQALSKSRAAVVAARAALESSQPDASYAPLSMQFPKTSTGRRKALALWLTRPDHPLTARVAVNHIWSRHFRTPLVSSMVDFGRNGAQPTHPQLLDWLAVELVESGWNMRHLHRLIVTSAAYRRLSSTTGAQASLALDPENKYLWRMNAWRMESEVVRDSLLYVADRLDEQRGGVELDNQVALTSNRRTLYYSSYPEAGGKSALGELFDAPDPLECYRRATSIDPQQALALTNSQLVHQSSESIVRAWQHGSGDDADERFIEYLFARLLTRAPSAQELHLCRSALIEQRLLATEPNSVTAQVLSRESLARILLNHNDFVTVR